jgi:alanine racemase
VQEGVALRNAGVDAPILVLSEQPTEELPAALAHDLQLTVYSHAMVEAIAAAGANDHPVHLKVDTGMHRVGCPPADALELARLIVGHPAVRLEGLMTHFATADEPDSNFVSLQMQRFDDVLDKLAADDLGAPLVHLCNSAGLLAWPRAHRTMVRAGIAIFGLQPGPALAQSCASLQPALSLHARVSHVARHQQGDGVSYGLRHHLAHDSTIATVPIGYADGVPRRLGLSGGEVLIGGRRRRVVGQVTMDQLLVDCADDHVSVGDEVVLIGRQGDEMVTADEWAQRCSTIGYEIVCALSARLPRVVADSPDRA